MISYKSALKIIVKNNLKIGDETIFVNKALRRVSAKNIYSPINYPLADNTAFDGFALVSKETKNINKIKTKKFKITKTIAAGNNPRTSKYKKGTAVEIMTGGIIPKPFDTVIPFESVNILKKKNINTHILVNQSVKKYSHVRFAGSDYKKKDLVIKKGQIIQPKHLMAFNTLGIKNILVKKKPKIMFVSTGSEIVKNLKKKILPWQIRNSNTNYILALNDYVQSKIFDGGIIKDSEINKFKKILKKIFNSKIDIFITSGAVSAGKFDFIPKITKENKIKILFKNVAIRPGKPIMFSKFNGKNKLFFGLPGNPISSAACFRFFVYPLIRKSIGLKPEKKLQAKLKSNFIKKKEFTRFLKGIVSVDKKGRNWIKILKGQESYKIRSFAASNSWAIFYAGKDKFRKGDFVDYVPINP